MSVPDVSGADIKTAEQLEAENGPKVERLAALGVPEAIVNAIAIQVRVEAIVSVFPPNIRAELERRYEAALGQELDDFYASLTAPKLVVPQGVKVTSSAPLDATE